MIHRITLTLLACALASLGIASGGDRHRSRRYDCCKPAPTCCTPAPTCCAYATPSCVAPVAPAAPATPAPAAAPAKRYEEATPAPGPQAQSNRRTYRSYSYEPAPAAAAPARRSTPSRFSNQFPADRKFRGGY
jgi:hypothetical protein